MFCPNCGTENSKAQKFCTRCGTNLLMIDRAREIIGEMTGGMTTPSFSPNLLLVTVAVISIIGFIALTIGTVELFRMDNGGSPISIIFGFGGFTALVLICRYLLGLVKPSAKTEVRLPNVQNMGAPSPTLPRGATNRSLNEAATSYQSIVEDPTRQFERERSSNS